MQKDRGMRNELAARSGRRWRSGLVVLAALATLLAAGFAFPQGAVAATGTISTVAGSDPLGDFSGDGGPATAAALNNPAGVAMMPDGGYLIADAGAARIRRVSATGIITTVAGNGTPSYSGDGGPATAAGLYAPSGVAPMPDGGYVIADTGNSRVRQVFPDGTITTVAGTGTPGFSGDGGPATAAQLGINSPYSVAVTADGGFLIGDEVNRRVRLVSPSGIITTVAGTGVQGSSGDGGAATAAQLNVPMGVAATPDGGFLIADEFSNRVRWVSPTGVITTVAGTGTLGFAANGDGGPATAANIYFP